MKYITVNNYKKFKPSEFIKSFISDIEVAEKIGKPMDMAELVGNGCLPCLGGMACMNMGISPYRKHSIIGDKISRLGDNIRLGDSYFVRKSVEDIFDVALPISTIKNRAYIHGIIKTKKEFGRLKKQVAFYVEILKKAGF